MTFMLSITPWPVLSALIWIVLVVTALYFARPTAHKAIRAVADTLYRAFRLGSRAVARAETRLAARNRDVLLAQGREAKERIERYITEAEAAGAKPPALDGRSFFYPNPLATPAETHRFTFALDDQLYA